MKNENWLRNAILLCVLVLLGSGLWAEETLKTPALQIGQTYHGFKLIRDQQIPELQVTALLFEHVKSGARLLKLITTDDNRVFTIAFRTPPDNDCGTPHIIEHTVLNGSRKFPVKSPFDVLSKGSLNTFINAFTGNDMTCYPVASRNEKDFFNLMDVYLDAVYYPLIYQEPKIFAQEGWHHELNDRAEPVTYKGVVYNEMKGAYSSPNRELNYQIYKNLFPDSCYRFTAGGHPNAIPELSYQKFLQFHKTLYHPANSYIFLYGNGDALSELRFIDENYLNRFGRTDVDSTIPLQKPFTAMKEVTATYAVAASENLKGKAFLTMTFIAGEAVQRDLSMALDILCEVLVNQPSAPLRRALQQAGIGEDVYAGHDELRQNVWSIVVRNAEENQREQFKQVVLSTLQTQVRQGLDKKLIEGVINRTEFALREGGESGGFPRGLQQFFRVLAGWFYADDPILSLQYEKPLQMVKTSLKTDYLEKIISKYFLGNPHTLLLVLKPDNTQEEKNNARTVAELANFKAAQGDAEIARLVAATGELKKYQETPDTPEKLATIPMLTLKDINPKADFYNADPRSIAGRTVLAYPAPTAGIVYLRLWFDLSAVPRELVPYASLISALLGELNTSLHQFGDLNNELNINTGGVDFELTGFSRHQDANQLLPVFAVRGKVLNDKLERMLDLIAEIVTQTDYTGKQRLQEKLTELNSRLESMVKNNGLQVALRRLNSYFTPLGQYAELARGLTFAHFIADLTRNFNGRADEIIANLQKTADLIFRRENLSVGITAGEEECRRFGQMAPAFFVKLAGGRQAVPPVGFAFVPADKNEGLLSASKVQYVVQGFNFKSLGYSYSGRMALLNQILSTDYLQNTIRVLGGAYGGFSNFDRNGNVYFASYRDPNLKETLDNYAAAVKYLNEFQVDETGMTRFIIGTIAALDTPLLAPEKGDRAFASFFEGATAADSQRERDEVLSARVADIRATAKLVADILAKRLYCVYGNEQKIIANQPLFDKLVKISE